MRLKIHGRHLAIGEAARERIERRLGFALGRFGNRVGRVAVHLADVNGPRGGVDKRCRVVAELPGHAAIVVEEADADLNALIDRAADRAGEAVRRRLELARLYVGPARPTPAERDCRPPPPVPGGQEAVAPAPPGDADRLRQLVLARFGGRVRDFRVVVRGSGFVLQGWAGSFYLKQMIQEAVLGATAFRLAANEIAVDGGVRCKPSGRSPPAVSRSNHSSCWESDMPQLRELMEKVLADGKIDGREVETLTGLLYADGRIDRAEAEFLFQLHRRVERAAPGFDRFFYAAVKQHVLTDGAINAEEAAWLRRVIFADGRVSEREKKLLRELKGEAARTSPEFEALFDECVTSVSKPGRGRPAGP